MPTNLLNPSFKIPRSATVLVVNAVLAVSIVIRNSSLGIYDSTQTATVVARARAMTSFPDIEFQTVVYFTEYFSVLFQQRTCRNAPAARTVAPALPRLVKSFLSSNLKLSSSIHPVSHSVSMDYIYTKYKPGTTEYI